MTAKTISGQLRRAVAPLAALGALGALAFAAAAGAEKPVQVEARGIQLTLNGGYAPNKASRTTKAPVSFNFSSKIRTVDGSRPPALSELILELDKNVAVNVAGLPICHPFRQEYRALIDKCRGAIIGFGAANVEIQFPEQSPITRAPPMVLFNGGARNGVTYVYAVFTLSAPTQATMIATIRAKAIAGDRFGTRATISIPKLAGGSGSVTYFSMTIDKKYVVTASCPDSRLWTHAEAVFENGVDVKATLRRDCIPRRAD